MNYLSYLLTWFFKCKHNCDLYWFKGIKYNWYLKKIHLQSCKPKLKLSSGLMIHLDVSLCRFGELSCRDVCRLLNTIKVRGVQLVALKVQNDQWDKPQLWCVCAETTNLVSTSCRPDEHLQEALSSSIPPKASWDICELPEHGRHGSSVKLLTLSFMVSGETSVLSVSLSLYLVPQNQKLHFNPLKLCKLTKNHGWSFTVCSTYTLYIRAFQLRAAGLMGQNISGFKTLFWDSGSADSWTDSVLTLTEQRQLTWPLTSTVPPSPGSAAQLAAEYPALWPLTLVGAMSHDQSSASPGDTLSQSAVSFHRNRWAINNIDLIMITYGGVCCLGFLFSCVSLCELPLFWLAGNHHLLCIRAGFTFCFVVVVCLKCLCSKQS